MNKIKLYATYNRQCYVKGYGRMFYKKGVELVNIKDYNGNVVIEKINKALTKALEKCLGFVDGTKIEFDAVIDGNDISYISNVKEVK